MPTDRLTHCRGYTLLELMITVAIIALLATIAYPSYQNQVMTGRRVDAQAVLVQAAHYLERFHTENARYDQNLAGTSVSLPSNLNHSPVDGGTTYYNIALQSVDRTSFVLRASPVNAQAGDGFLEYTSTGVKRWDRDNSGGITTGENCWNRHCGS